MKNLMLILFLLACSVTFYSCKECTACDTPDPGGDGKVCADEFNSHQEYEDYINIYCQ